MAQITLEVSDLVTAIRDRIDELGVSDAEAARRIGVSPQVLSNWKHGRGMNIDGDLQLGVAKFLGVSPARVVELMGYSLSSEELRPYLSAVA